MIINNSSFPLSQWMFLQYANEFVEKCSHSHSSRPHSRKGDTTRGLKDFTSASQNFTNLLLAIFTQWKIAHTKCERKRKFLSDVFPSSNNSYKYIFTKGGLTLETEIRVVTGISCIAWRMSRYKIMQRFTSKKKLEKLRWASCKFTFLCFHRCLYAVPDVK